MNAKTITNIPAPADLPGHPVVAYEKEDGSGVVDCPCGFRRNSRYAALPILEAHARLHHQELRIAAAADALLEAAEGIQVTAARALEDATERAIVKARDAKNAEIARRREEYLNGYSTASLERSAAQVIGGSFGDKPTGYARAATYLLQVTDAGSPDADLRRVRANLATEARIRGNVIGGRHADQVSEVVRAWNAGRRELPYSAANTAMLERRNTTGRDEPMAATFAGLQVHPTVR